MLKIASRQQHVFYDLLAIQCSLDQSERSVLEITIHPNALGGFIALMTTYTSWKSLSSFGGSEARDEVVEHKLKWYVFGVPNPSELT